MARLTFGSLTAMLAHERAARTRRRREAEHAGSHLRISCAFDGKWRAPMYFRDAGEAAAKYDELVGLAKPLPLEHADAELRMLFFRVERHRYDGGRWVMDAPSFIGIWDLK